MIPSIPSSLTSSFPSPVDTLTSDFSLLSLDSLCSTQEEGFDCNKFLDQFKRLDKKQFFSDLHTMLLTDSAQGTSEKPGRSVSLLYALALAAGEGKPEAFKEFFDYVKRNATGAELLQAFVRPVQAGRSVLYWLAGAATNGDPETFRDVFTYLRASGASHVSWYLFRALTRLAEEGPDKGKSAFYWLAAAVANGKPETFKEVFDYAKRNATGAELLAFVRPVQAGRSVLYWLAVAAATGHPEAFRDVFTYLKASHVSSRVSENLFEALVRSVGEGLDKGKSALYWLAAATANGRLEDFIDVVTYLKTSDVSKKVLNGLSEALTKKAQEGPHEGMSALNYLAIAAANGKPKAFMDIFPYLWCASTSRRSGHYEDVSTIFDEEPRGISDGVLFSAIYSPVQKGSCVGKSALHYLAIAAANGKPEAFIDVLTLLITSGWSEKLLFEVLMRPAKEGPDKGKSVLSCLAVADSSTVKSIGDLIGIKDLNGLIAAKNKFYKSFEEFKRKSKFEMADVSLLYQLAREAEAHSAGDVTAIDECDLYFYDVASKVFEIGMIYSWDEIKGSFEIAHKLVQHPRRNALLQTIVFTYYQSHPSLNTPSFRKLVCESASVTEIFSAAETLIKG